MATSGSYDFAVTRNDIIRDAFLELGVIDHAATVDAKMISDASRQLNMMIKSWHVMYNLWRFSDITITLDGSQSYTIGPTGADVTAQRPVKITYARRVEDSNYEIPIDVVSLQEYKAQPLKSSTGSVVQVAYDPQLDTGVLYVWGAPTSGSIIVTALLPLMDFDSASDNPQFPIEWALGIVKNLAVLLHPQYPGSTLQQETIAMANATLTALESFDSENTSVFFQPTMRA